MRGYRLDDMCRFESGTLVPIFSINPVKDSCYLSRIVAQENKVVNNATNVSRTLPFYVYGASYCKPDPKDPLMTALGAAKRVGSAVYKTTMSDRELYARFVREKFCPMFESLDPGDFTSFEDWLVDLNFSQVKKDELAKAHDELNDVGIFFNDDEWVRWFSELNGFIKDEFYDTEKASRWINARNAKVKGFFGPIAQDVMNVFKKHPSVIKTVPVEDRAKMIFEELHSEGAVYHVTDYTSFEAHFEEWLMEIEGLFYYWIIKHHPGLKLFASFLDKILCGRNVSEMKGFGSFLFLALRCSGEMNTSLGNTFHNMATAHFLAWLKDCSIKGFVEGDDGLFVFEPPERAPTTEDFKRFGWIIKLETFDFIGDTSFCGNVFSPEDFIVVTDPRKVMLTLGWTPRRYLGSGPRMMRSLLKSKVMSMACSYGKNPIIWKLSSRLLKLLEGVKVRKSIVDGADWYHRDVLQRALEEKFEIEEPPMATRVLVERLYGIPVWLQFQVEQELDQITLGPWNPPPGLFTSKQEQNWTNYVSDLPWVFRSERSIQPWVDALADKIPLKMYQALSKYSLRFDMGDYRTQFSDGSFAVFKQAEPEPSQDFKALISPYGPASKL